MSGVEDRLAVDLLWTERVCVSFRETVLALMVMGVMPMPW